jgi:hypothetical protein
MSDPAERLRVRLEVIFAARDARLRAQREKAEEAARRRAAFLDAFAEKASSCVLPAFEVAVRTVEAHGFEGRVRHDPTPEEGPPSIRFEMHPGGESDRDPALGRATLRYEADPEGLQVQVERSVGGGAHAAFARPFRHEARLGLHNLSEEAIEAHLAELVARAVDEPEV